MDGTTRRTRFQTRVYLEREFLTLVNEKLAGSAPLAGMTGDAIDNWANRAKQVHPVGEINELYELLIEISVRAELMADHSRDVFTPDQRLKPNSLDELRKLLMKTLSEQSPHPAN